MTRSFASMLRCTVSRASQLCGRVPAAKTLVSVESNSLRGAATRRFAGAATTGVLATRVLPVGWRFLCWWSIITWVLRPQQSHRSLSSQVHVLAVTAISASSLTVSSRILVPPICLEPK